MKKLLALILCVMMFVSVISTSAFAADPDTYGYSHGDQRVWRGASQSKDIVDALRTNMNTMYGIVAADTAVYKSVKAIDTVIDDLFSEVIKEYSNTPNGLNVTGSAIKDAVIAGMRSTVGGEISKYLNAHRNEYYVYDKNGNRVLDPAKYAGVFATAASNAISSEKAVAGIQAYMYAVLNASTYNKMREDYVSLMNDVKSWGNWGKYGFDDHAQAFPHMPGWDIDHAGNNRDGTMHGLDFVYDAYLTNLGMLGVDLNSDGLWNTGVGTKDAPGVAWDIFDGEYVATIGEGTDGFPGDGSENINTPEFGFVKGANLGVPGYNNYTGVLTGISGDVVGGNPVNDIMIDGNN